MAASARVPAQEKRRVGRVRRAVQLGARLTGWREGRGTRSDNPVLSDIFLPRRLWRVPRQTGWQSADARYSAGMTCAAELSAMFRERVWGEASQSERHCRS